MSFRLRLALFLVATLAAVQLLTAVLVYGVTRQRLIREGGLQLTAAGAAFERQLQDVSERVAENVQVLASDFALRSAIAQRDQATVLSALRNHGHRVGATRMMLLDVNGSVRADTEDPSAAPRAFALRDLLNRALAHPATAIVGGNGSAYWTVVVPVFAPTLIGLIAADIPIDDRVLDKLQRQSALPKNIELVTQVDHSSWKVVARGNDRVTLTAHLLAAQPALPDLPATVNVEGQEYVALAVKLTPEGAAPLVAVLGYSVDEALEPYRSLATAWTTLLAIGLVVGLIGALLIARGVARPVELLAATARRIAAGDYRQPALLQQGGELGDLAAAFASMASAIGEREEHIRHQASHDSITGLPSRAGAEDRIEQQLVARSGQPGAMLMIGVTHLAAVVKTMGHAISDRLMRDAGARLRSVVGEALLARATDRAFCVWLPHAERAQALEMGRRALNALSEPYHESDLGIDLAPAVGIALFPAHGARAAALLQRAEVALFAATGSAEPLVYDPATDPHRPERLSLMSELRDALDHQNELSLHYQPKVRLATRQVDGAEGLVRWNHPRRGLVPPDSFIGLAEETGNIHRLTRWVLATGIAQMQRWASRGWLLKTSVNVSARDLSDSSLPRKVRDLLGEHQLAPGHIVLEVTESAVMADPDGAERVLRSFADNGIEIAIDDFGVGHSSLGYLHRLPVSELKIDKTFVRNLAGNADDRAIVKTIVELGHRLGHRITAEGVEDSAALDYLAGIGCDHAQGYHITKALPADAFEDFLSTSEWRPRQ